MKYELRENGLDSLGYIDPIFDAFMFGNTNNSLATDIEENENEFNVTVNVPGMKKEDIKLSVENGYLNISYEFKKEDKNVRHHFLRKERFYQSSSRSFYLGDVDGGGVKATLENGVLNVVVPKLKVEDKTHYIQIQ